MITIKKPGLLTSVQDLGRYGFQKYGVIASGAMDTRSHRISNLLVGNEEGAASLEISLIGPEIHFEETALISICGGNFTPSISGYPVRQWRPLIVKKGSTLRFSGVKSGCRAYLSIAGGFLVPEIMASKSTYLRAEIGGHNGRALKAGDSLKSGRPGELSQSIFQALDSSTERNFVEMDWSAASNKLLSSAKGTVIRVVKGRQFDWFSENSQKRFFEETFEITPQSDRMGYRLSGESLSLSTAKEMVSEAVNFGSIQVPADGNPIILLADRQTSGGYPKIAETISADLPLLAQAKPGDRLRFIEITLEDAQRLYIKSELEIQQLKQGIILKANQNK
ncbi:biotin-dependent carboxyltransferase family protein [Peribacillus kribbensis]|uniref:5-oxoprolinase subunit C family protein n=1 Tax=Peribacillus kribbensis TaxID=356658 RepID=UPI0003F4CC2B|nr:biotin-dependent carboxyltransferase family protein [Peribacillus kribbensis]